MKASSHRIETDTGQQTPDAMFARAWPSRGMIAILAFALLVVQSSLFGQVASVAPGEFWHGPDGNPLPLQGHEEITEFLLKARVVSSKRIGEGINNPLKVLLERDGVQMHAIFRDVSVRKSRVKLGNRYRFNFRDEALFEVAAYELGRLLGLNNIPPAVKGVSIWAVPGLGRRAA